MLIQDTKCYFKISILLSVCWWFDSFFPSKDKKETRNSEAELPLEFLERIFLSIDVNSSSWLQHWCTFPYASVSQTPDNKLKIHHLTGILEMMFFSFTSSMVPVLLKMLKTNSHVSLRLSVAAIANKGLHKKNTSNYV